MSNTDGKVARRLEETIIKRVSRRTREEDGGGTWKIAFADFCLALLCLFMVLWLLAARDSEEITQMQAVSAVYQGGAGIFDGAQHQDLAASQEPSAFPRTQGHAETGRASNQDAGLDELRSLAQAIEQAAQEAGLQNNLQIVSTPVGLRVMLHDTHRRGIFELGSAMPDPAFARLMQRMGRLFAQVDNPLLVVGHTDARQYPDPLTRSNWELSSERALAARGSLLRGGMSADRLLQVVGMAERAPLDPADPHSALNRRIEFLVLTKSQALKIERMFGSPASVISLMDGVDAAVAPAAQTPRADGAGI